MAISMAGNMSVLLWLSQKIYLPSHVKALISGNSPARTCKIVDICDEAWGSRNGGVEQKSVTGRTIGDLYQLKKITEGGRHDDRIH